jgi:hypothetical protein
MLFRGTSFLLGAIGIGGASIVCLPCGSGGTPAGSPTVHTAAPAPGTATVTFADSLGVVWYDPQRTAPRTIASELVRLTGFRASVISHTSRARRGAAS